MCPSSAESSQSGAALPARLLEALDCEGVEEGSCESMEAMLLALPVKRHARHAILSVMAMPAVVPLAAAGCARNELGCQGTLEQGPVRVVLRPNQ